MTHLLQDGTVKFTRCTHAFFWGELCSVTVSRPRRMSAYIVHPQIRVIRRTLILLLSCLPLVCHSPIRRLFFNQHPLHRLFGSACWKSQFSSSNFCCFRSYCCFNIFGINIIKPDVSPGKYKFNYIKVVLHLNTVGKAVFFFFLIKKSALKSSLLLSSMQICCLI